MKGVPVPSGAPAPVAPLPPRRLSQSVHFSMATSVHFSMAIDRRPHAPCFVDPRRRRHRLGARRFAPLSRVSLRTLTGPLRGTSPGVPVNRKGQDALREGDRVTGRTVARGLARIDEITPRSTVMSGRLLPIALLTMIPKVSASEVKINTSAEVEARARDSPTRYPAKRRSLPAHSRSCAPDGPSRRIRGRLGAFPARGSRVTCCGSRHSHYSSGDGPHSPGSARLRVSWMPATRGFAIGAKRAPGPLTGTRDSAVSGVLVNGGVRSCPGWGIEVRSARL